MDKVVEEVETAAGVGWVAGGDALHDADLVLRGVGVLGRALDDLQSDVLAQLRVVCAPHGREVAPADLAHHDVASVVECVANVHRVVSAAAVALHALVLAHSSRKRHLCVRQCRLETQKQRKKERKKGRKNKRQLLKHEDEERVCVCAWGTNEVRRGHVGSFKSCHPGSVVAVVLWARARESGRWGGERLQQNAGTPTDTTKKKWQRAKKKKKKGRKANGAEKGNTTWQNAE